LHAHAEIHRYLDHHYDLRANSCANGFGWPFINERYHQNAGAILIHDHFIAGYVTRYAEPIRTNAPDESYQWAKHVFLRVAKG
jgi:hypothetical protein